MYKNILETKLVDKTATLGIVGLGYVGLPTAVEKASIGYSVIGFDVSKEKILDINAGVNYISDVDNQLFKNLVSSGNLSATTDFSRLIEVDVVFICVPTPIDEYKQPDLSFVKQSSLEISKHIKKGTLVILESTTYPGTTEEILVPAFVDAGFTIGEDMFVAYSPERIDPGNAKFGLFNTPKIVGGVTEPCTNLAALAIGEMAHKVSSTKVAEMAKVFENTFRFINIALVNETAQLCDDLDIDAWEMLEAAGTKPYGFMPFQPGPGVGGHCIPVDPYYLTHKAKSIGKETKMIELAGTINDSMSEHVLNRVFKLLNQEGKALRNSKIAVLGVSYKKDINDARETPVLPILEKLQATGTELLICDPFIDEIQVNGQNHHLYKDEKVIVGEVDLVIVTTDHSSFNYEYIANHSKVIFDTRNVFKNANDVSATIIKL